MGDHTETQRSAKVESPNPSMAAGRNPEKAARYISQLNIARGNGRWQDVPKLARKVEKHAPQRKCLSLTAKAEALVLGTETSSLPNNRQATNEGIRQLIPSMTDTVNVERTYSQDAFQGQTCLAWMYWHIGESSSALSTLPQTIPEDRDTVMEKEMALEPWTYICILRGAWLRGHIEERNGSLGSALKAYAGAPVDFTSLPSSVSSMPAFGMWAEKLLSQCCALSNTAVASQKISNGNTSVDIALKPFRSYAAFYEGQRNITASVSGPSLAQRRDTWKLYHDTLSTVIQSAGGGLPTSPICTDGTELGRASTTMASDEPYPLLSELQQVEAAFEDLLLKTVPFPTANTINFEIDNWINQMMANWSTIVRYGWYSNSDQETASRRTLEMLYRAATRSFHSTCVLRHLFTVHCSLAEFELASHALDTYLEIVLKAKARIAKSGQPEAGLDNDSIMLLTMSVGMIMLCTYGRRKEVERAQLIAQELKRWLSPLEKGQMKLDLNLSNGGTRSSDEAQHDISTDTLATVHRALGVASAQWARTTYEEVQRNWLQDQSIRHFKRSLIYQPPASGNLETLIAMAMVQAETNDLEAALASVKIVLSIDDDSENRLCLNHSTRTSTTSSLLTPQAMSRSWHLLALLLTARKDFEMAQATVEAGLNPQRRMLRGGQPIPRLNFFEKQDVLELVMTQVSITQVLEGPEAALNASMELPQLYAQLFSTLKELPKSQKQDSLEPLKTSHSKARSFRGSIFGRSNRSQADVRENVAAGPSTFKPAPNELSRPPTIAINDEKQSIPPSSSHSRPLTGEHSAKLRKRDSRKSVQQQQAVNAAELNSLRTSITHDKHATTEGLHGERTSLPGIEHVNDHSQKPTKGDSSVPGSFSSVQDADASEGWIGGEILSKVHQILFTSIFRPILPVEVEKRYAIGLLVKIWLIIARLYRQAQMFEDAENALNEATNNIRVAETLLMQTCTTSRELAQRGWGGARSNEELWADLFAEKGQLCLARSAPHEALRHFESALSYWDEHPEATINLSDILLDIYRKHTPPYPPDAALTKLLSRPNSTEENQNKSLLAQVPSDEPLETSGNVTTSRSRNSVFENEFSISATPTDLTDSPESLDRLAARDRAFGLLSILTKLGSGWNNSSAWLALGRAYEETGQVAKAKKALWWVVELEETRPIRDWNVLGPL